MAKGKKSARRALTADDLFQIVVVSDPHVSPDGQTIAWVQTHPVKDDDLYRASLWIASRDGTNPRQLTSGQHRDNTPQWSPDSVTLAFVSNRPHVLPQVSTDEAEPKSEAGKPTNQVWSIRTDGGEAIQQTHHQYGAAEPAWSPDGRTIAFIGTDDITDSDEFKSATSLGPIADERVVRDLSYRFDGRGWLEKYAHVWTTVVDSGESTQITTGDSYDSLPSWSPDGTSIAFASNRCDDRKRFWNRSAIQVVSATGGEVTTVTPEDASFTMPVWSPTGERIAFLGHLGTGSAANVCVWTTSQDGSGLTNHTEKVDISFGDSGMSDLHTGSYGGPRWIDDSSLLVLASQSGQTQVYRVDLSNQKVTELTSGEHRIAGFTPVGDDLAVVRGTSVRPFELELWSGSGITSSISRANDAFLQEVNLVEAQNFPVTSHDGKDIQGWLIPPRGFDRKSKARHPMIVQIHGGPHSMYGYAMFHEMQLMAARGYAVLYTNPRGSAGYGEEFTSCTKGIWGEADMPDVIAAVDAAARLPWIDPDRLGITGGSYGGYLTNWIIGHDQRFKAAVTQRCVSNFHSFFGTSDIGTTFGVTEFDGLPWTDAAKLLKHSPISYVGEIDTPLLILHSEQDLRCPIEQAEQMFAALKYQDKVAGFVRIPEEGHELSRAGTPSRRLARLHHLLGWFDQHI